MEQEKEPAHKEQGKHARKNKVVRTRKGTKNSNGRHKKGS